MAWTLDRTRKVWMCTKYSDLNYAEINNLAEYGQPYSPYDRGMYDHNFIPDFGNVTVEMPQLEVMTSGYGGAIKPESFPVVKKFLKEKLTLPNGTYTFNQLKAKGFAVDADRWIRTNLYGWGGYGIQSGSIAGGDAAYIHGTVGIALMSGTRFTLLPPHRRVDAEMGAGNDNWDFNSSTIPAWLNATVATIMGPDHYNLTAPIKINFTGPGRRATAASIVK